MNTPEQIPIPEAFKNWAIEQANKGGYPQHPASCYIAAALSAYRHLSTTPSIPQGKLPHMSGNILSPNGISEDWLKIWSEVENWYGDIQKKETGAQLLKRLQMEFPLATPSDTGARWVRASERLPEKDGLICFKINGGYGNYYVTTRVGGRRIIVESGNNEIKNWKSGEWLSEGPAPAPLQENGIREAIETRLKELEALIAAEKLQRADLPRGSAYHREATENIGEYRIRYDELNKLPSSPLPLSDKK